MNAARHPLVLFALFALVVAHKGAADSATKPATKPAESTNIRTAVLHDAKRGKDLRVTVHVPSVPGPYPLVVFSHGAGGSGEYYNALTGGWAANGYVVIAPTHADSISLKTPQERRKLRPRDVVIDAVTDVKGWQERPRDVSFVLDSLEELQRRVPELAGKIDRDRIGVAGHSYGAMTAAILAGATIRTKLGGELQSFADPRVKAAIVLSGQGEGQMGFVPGSWAAVEVPLMVMTGSADRGARGQDPRWRKAAFDHSPAGEKYWLFIDGATHMSFTGRGADPAVFDVVRRATQAFWDAQLKTDADARKLLQSERLATGAAVGVEYERR